MTVLIKEFGTLNTLFSGEWPFGSQVAERYRFEGAPYELWSYEYSYSSATKNWTLYIYVKAFG